MEAWNSTSIIPEHKSTFAREFLRVPSNDIGKIMAQIFDFRYSSGRLETIHLASISGLSINQNKLDETLLILIYRNMNWISTIFHIIGLTSKLFVVDSFAMYRCIKASRCFIDKNTTFFFIN